jgi:hypothetical protein
MACLRLSMIGHTHGGDRKHARGVEAGTMAQALSAKHSHLAETDIRLAT